jgi:hypothetical protein
MTWQSMVQIMRAVILLALARLISLVSLCLTHEINVVRVTDH